MTHNKLLLHVSLLLHIPIVHINIIINSTVVHIRMYNIYILKTSQEFVNWRPYNSYTSTEMLTSTVHATSVGRL